jgi:hypothetical protein
VVLVACEIEAMVVGQDEDDVGKPRWCRPTSHDFLRRERTRKRVGERQARLEHALIAQEIGKDRASDDQDRHDDQRRGAGQRTQPQVGGLAAPCPSDEPHGEMGDPDGQERDVEVCQVDG